MNLRVQSDQTEEMEGRTEGALRLNRECQEREGRKALRDSV